MDTSYKKTDRVLSELQSLDQDHLSDQSLDWLLGYCTDSKRCDARVRTRANESMPRAGIPGTPAATTAGAGVFAPPPDLTFSIGATEEAAARRARRRPATGFTRSSAVEPRQVELRPASAAHRARRKAERRTADRIRGGAHRA